MTGIYYLSIYKKNVLHTSIAPTPKTINNAKSNNTIII